VRRGEGVEIKGEERRGSREGVERERKRDREERVRDRVR